MRSVLAVRASLVLALALVLVAPAARGSTYLVLEGTQQGPIEGDVTAPEGIAIDILDYQQTTVLSVDPSTGTPDGRREFYPLQFRKKFDPSTVDLLRAVDRVERMLRFQLMTTAATTPVLRVDLTDAALLSVDFAFDDQQGLFEIWTVVYDRIRWEDLITGEVYEDGMGSTSVAGGFPEGFARVASVPNPTSGPTEFSFRVPSTGPVSIDVFDFRGRRVARVYEGTAFRNEGTVAWNGMDDLGSPVASGVYLVKMRAGEWLTTQKLTIVR